jgi:hypothetical protein
MAQLFVQPNFNNYSLDQAMVGDNKATFIGRGHITAAVSNVPEVLAGSQIECGGSLYFCDADEAPMGNTGFYMYIVPGINNATFQRSDIVPTYNATKGGYYNGNNRAIAQQDGSNWLIIGGNQMSDGGSNGRSGLDQCLQNIVNEQNGMNAVPQTNGTWDSFMSEDENIIFNLASNYSAGMGTISLTFVQPENLGKFKQKHLYPFRTQIYDNVNKSYMVLTGDNGAADVQI